MLFLSRRVLIYQQWWVRTISYRSRWNVSSPDLKYSSRKTLSALPPERKQKGEISLWSLLSSIFSYLFCIAAPRKTTSLLQVPCLFLQGRDLSNRWYLPVALLSHLFLPQNLSKRAQWEGFPCLLLSKFEGMSFLLSFTRRRERNLCALPVSGLYTQQEKTMSI